MELVAMTNEREGVVYVNPAAVAWFSAVADYPSGDEVADLTNIHTIDGATFTVRHPVKQVRAYLTQ
jgi:hypothetical protein